METLDFLRLFERVRGQCSTANLLGVHLEGPYFSMNQRGAQDPKYIKAPQPEEYEQILSASNRIIRWSAAPELSGTSAFARRLREKSVLPSIAHSDAVYEEVVEAFELGFRHVTHLYSGMSTIIRKDGFRYPGVLESAYAIDEMTVEIIADNCHLPPELLKLVYKSKGPDQIALVTDSMRAAGQPEGESILGSLQKGQRVIVEDGVAKLLDKTAFAGSVATADRLVRTMVQAAEVPLSDAIRMMSSTPAKILGLKNKGVLSAGYDADMVIFDRDIRVKMTIVGGTVVYSVKED